MPVSRQRGFTLIELIVVIAILGVLAAVALPRFTDMTSQAHDAAIRGASGGLASAVALVKAQWVTNGAAGATNNLAGYGADNINVSAEGWPVGVTGGNTDPTAVTAAQCVALWQNLLQGSAPPVSTTAGAGIDYVVSTVGNGANLRCRYRYQNDGSNRDIEYFPSTGVVTVDP